MLQWMFVSVATGVVNGCVLLWEGFKNKYPTSISFMGGEEIVGGRGGDGGREGGDGGREGGDGRREERRW